MTCLRVAAARGAAASAGAGSLVLSFDHGYIKDSSTRSEAALLSGQGTTLVAAEFAGARMLYTGRLEPAKLGKTLLLLRNKTTGKVRAVEVGTVNMRADVHDAPVLSDPVEAGTLELSRTFGSKKQKQQMEQREKLKVDASVISAQMKQVVDSADTAGKVDLTAYMKRDSDDFYIPPINRDADRVQDVYQINHILTAEQIEKIGNETEDKDFTAEFTPYMKGFAAKVNVQTCANGKELLIYANALLKLYLESYKEIVKKTFSVCAASSTINELALSNFTQMSNNKRTRPNPLKDKAICHVIVMLLLANSFKFELEPFAAAVKVTPKTVGTKVQAVGAHVALVGREKHIVLKVPLNTSKSFTRRKSAKF